MTHGKELLVGAIIIMAVVVAGGGILFMQGTNWGRATTYVEVLVRDVGQLTEGNAVKFRGVRIGEVASVEVEPGGDAVRLGLELVGEDVTIAEDAGVVVAPESMFGDWQAEIVTKSRFPRYDYYQVSPAELAGDTAVLGGYALPDLTRLTAAADAIAENVEALTERFDRTFNDSTAQDLSDAISNIQAISEEMRDLVAQAANTFDAVSGDVEATAEQISVAAVQARMTLDEIGRTFQDGQVDAILSNLQAATQDIEVMAENLSGTSTDLGETLDLVDSTFSRVDRIAAMVERGEGTLGRLLTDTLLVHEAYEVLAQLDSLLLDIQKNPRRYLSLSIF